ncbi:hypothetical protein [Verrucomicrobium sp. BvORR106]|uniref:immunity protein Imm33 domain-containing protein n=1 Tax=Verrucomicrobium sp. BvORR106 TaxID=1403819 RepID=UPI00068E79B9|nr:hypothetical protein [Verrucomicrobium sp. BvORR106]
MTTLRTSTGPTRGQLEIQFEVDDEIAESGGWLVDYLNHSIHTGTLYQAGETIQIGWMIALLDHGALTEESPCLELWEPDFQTVPIQWQRGLNQTFRHLVLQSSVCESLQCEPMFPEIRSAGIVSPSFPHSQQFAMWREETSGSDSGWMFDHFTQDSSQGEFQSLYHIVLAKPEIVPFLALPVGSLITWNEIGVVVQLEEKRISSSDAPVLDGWFRKHTSA